MDIKWKAEFSPSFFLIIKSVLQRLNVSVLLQFWFINLFATCLFFLPVLIIILLLWFLLFTDFLKNFLFFSALRCNWQIHNCNIFKVYIVMIWHTYILWSDDQNQASPCIPHLKEKKFHVSKHCVLWCSRALRQSQKGLLSSPCALWHFPGFLMAKRETY